MTRSCHIVVVDIRQLAQCCLMTRVYFFLNLTIIVSRDVIHFENKFLSVIYAWVQLIFFVYGNFTVRNILNQKYLQSRNLSLKNAKMLRFLISFTFWDLSNWRESKTWNILNINILTFKKCLKLPTFFAIFCFKMARWAGLMGSNSQNCKQYSILH